MSMNLYFKVKGGGCLNFPIQTSMELSYAVLQEETLEKRMELIEKDLKTWSHFKENGEDLHNILNIIKVLLENEKLELSVW